MIELPVFAGRMDDQAKMTMLIAGNTWASPPIETARPSFALEYRALPRPSSRRDATAEAGYGGVQPQVEGGRDRYPHIYAVVQFVIRFMIHTGRSETRRKCYPISAHGNATGGR